MSRFNDSEGLENLGPNPPPKRQFPPTPIAEASDSLLENPPKSVEDLLNRLPS